MQHILYHHTQRTGHGIPLLNQGGWISCGFIGYEKDLSLLQFTALIHAVTGGILLQAIVFALSHGYQGWKYVLLIAVLAAMLGLLAHWRRSL